MAKYILPNLVGLKYTHNDMDELSKLITQFGDKDI